MWEYIAQMKCQAQDTTSRKIGCVRSGVWTIWSMLFVWIGMKRNFSACVNKMMSRKWVLLVFGEGEGWWVLYCVLVRKLLRNKLNVELWYWGGLSVFGDSVNSVRQSKEVNSLFKGVREK